MCLTVNKIATLDLMQELREVGGRGMPFFKNVKVDLSNGEPILMSPMFGGFVWESGLVKAVSREGPVVRKIKGDLLSSSAREVVEGGALHVYRKNEGHFSSTRLKVWGRYEDFVAANVNEACFTALWVDYDDLEQAKKDGMDEALNIQLRCLERMRARTKKRLYAALSNKVLGTSLHV